VAIELDDGSHRDAQRQKSDADKSKALEDAGVTLIRWNVKALPSVEEIKRQVAPILMAGQNGQERHQRAAPKSRSA
jgi:very-short-patch-repair endonuclease